MLWLLTNVREVRPVHNPGVPEDGDFADVALHLQESFLQNPEVEAFLQGLATYAATRLGSADHPCCCEITVMRPKKPAATAGSKPGLGMARLESTYGDGPGLTAMRTAGTVLVPDLRREQRWTEYVLDAKSGAQLVRLTREEGLEAGRQEVRKELEPKVQACQEQLRQARRRAAERLRKATPWWAERSLSTLPRTQAR